MRFQLPLWARQGWFWLLFSVGATSLPGNVNDYPQDYFRSPLGIPLYLSGSFAEMRSNHFHSGLDIKTNAKQGYRIYAAASGYVARIKVSPFGFGKVLYVKHPNGYTTVYAHLLGFNPRLDAFIKRLQYQKKRFGVEAFPGPNDFPVKKGEVIAYSGNSGSSGGPHLHFEIRDSKSEWPINPMLFGLPIRDNTPPTIYRVRLYAGDAQSYALVKMTGSAKARRVTMMNPLDLTVTKQKGRFRLKDVISMEAYGDIGFGLELKDFHEGSRSRLGAYRVKLTANEQPLFTYEAEKFSFATTRYLNAHVDYAERQKRRRWLQRSYLLPGNRLPMYHGIQNRGYLKASEGETYTMRYSVEDARGNTSTLNFSIKGTPRRSDLDVELPPHDAHIAFDAPYTFAPEGIRLQFPAGTFYEDVYLKYHTLAAPGDGYSQQHVVHNEFTPAHKYFTLSIKADRLPARLRGKAVVVRVNKGGKVSSIGGSYENGYVTAKTRDFGTFYVTVDTERPRIRPVNLPKNKNLSKAKSIRVKITDALSGVRSYRGYINDKWALFEYDAKRDLLIHYFDDRTPRGSHQLKIIVTDEVGNQSVYETAFRR